MCGYDLSDCKFISDLVKDQGLTEAVEASWIKTKKLFSKAVLHSFQKEVAGYINIPGE